MRSKGGRIRKRKKEKGEEGRKRERGRREGGRERGPIRKVRLSPTNILSG